MPSNPRIRRLFRNNLRRRFISAEWNEVGFYGWMPEGLEGANPGGGTLVAHDVMEHIAHVPCPFADEISAIGTLWHLRLDSGWYPKNGGRFDANGLAGEVGSVLRDAFFAGSGWPLKEPLFWDAKSREPMEDDYLEEPLKLAADEAVRVAIEEIESGEGDDAKERTKALFEEDQIAERALGWLRHGYRLSERRYAKIGTDHATWLFDLISQTVDMLRTEADTVEGITLDVSVNTEKGFARVRAPQLGRRSILIDPQARLYGLKA